MEFPESVERLIEALRGLPAIGPKSAARLAFFMMQAPPGKVEALAQAMLDVRTSIRPCQECHYLSDTPVCQICRDARRDAGLLCVVSDPREVAAMERTREFRGLYHVLGGVISPLDGIGPDQLTIPALLERLERHPFREVILATNPTVAGEATALYLHRTISSRVRVTRLALGLPVGSDLEYADEVTLGRALSGRREMESAK